MTSQKRFPNRDLLRELQREGWVITRLPGGHLRAVHPKAKGPLILPSTGGRGRGDRNARALARRLLRA